MAALARVHEFGAPDRNIPERSFIRSAMNEHGKEFERLIKKIARSMVSGKINKKQGLGILAQKAIDWIKAKIDSIVPPPNAPSTVRRKGSDVTLVDTGQLRNSLDWELKEGK